MSRNKKWDKWRNLIYILLWYIFSTSLSIYNKTLMSRDNKKFNFPILMSAMHSGTHMMISILLKRFDKKTIVPIISRWDYLTKVVNKQTNKQKIYMYIFIYIKIRLYMHIYRLDSIQKGIIYLSEWLLGTLCVSCCCRDMLFQCIIGSYHTFLLHSHQVLYAYLGFNIFLCI